MAEAGLSLIILAGGTPLLGVGAEKPVNCSIVCQPGAPNQVMLTWEATPGRSYYVLSADQPNPLSWSALNSSPLVGPTNTFTYKDSAAAGSRFYEIVSLSGGAQAPVKCSISYSGGEAGQIVLSWNATSGRSYNVLSTDQLNPVAWHVLNQIPLTAPTNLLSFQDLTMANSRYYRVVDWETSVQLILAGISEQVWSPTALWLPAAQSCDVSGSKTLISLGAWWDAENAYTSALPIDSNGSFSTAVNPTTTDASQWPVRVQVAYQTSAPAGLHIVNPPMIWVSGDGFFLLLEADGLSTNTPVADIGHTNIWHTPFGPGDPNSIQSVTVATDGTAARAGDLAVAVFVMDSYNNPDANVVLPRGWNLLGVDGNTVDNVAYGACYQLVTTPGKQSATFTWTDNSTPVADAAIVVFSAGGGPVR